MGFFMMLLALSGLERSEAGGFIPCCCCCCCCCVWLCDEMVMSELAGSGLESVLIVVPPLLTAPLLAPFNHKPLLWPNKVCCCCCCWWWNWAPPIGIVWLMIWSGWASDCLWMLLVRPNEGMVVVVTELVISWNAMPLKPNLITSWSANLTAAFWTRQSFMNVPFVEFKSWIM